MYYNCIQNYTIHYIYLVYLVHKQHMCNFTEHKLPPVIERSRSDDVKKLNQRSSMPLRMSLADRRITGKYMK